jgi:hypothetical protein
MLYSRKCQIFYSIRRVVFGTFAKISNGLDKVATVITFLAIWDLSLYVSSSGLRTWLGTRSPWG